MEHNHPPVTTSTTMRIPDPTVRTVLPTNLLRAVGQGHQQLYQDCRRLIDILDQVGWPHSGLTSVEPHEFEDYDDPSDHDYGCSICQTGKSDPVHQGGRFALEPEQELRTALDHARYTVQLTWVVCGLVDCLKESLGVLLADAYVLDEQQLKLRGQ